MCRAVVEELVPLPRPLVLLVEQVEHLVRPVVVADREVVRDPGLPVLVGRLEHPVTAVEDHVRRSAQNVLRIVHVGVADEIPVTVNDEPDLTLPLRRCGPET